MAVSCLTALYTRTMNSEVIASSFHPALQSRVALVEILHAEDTTCYRLFHGTNEGVHGLTIDRYGDYLLVQTWRETIELSLLTQLTSAVDSELGLKLTPVWNHRAKRGEVDYSVHSIEIPFGVNGQEMGLTYEVAPRHKGIDPLLFLDFRAGRRKIKAACADKSVLNLFSYTCGIGVVAASAGASEVVNVDFSKYALQTGETNAFKNGISKGFKTINEDAIPILLQYSGLGVRGRRAKRSFKRVGPRNFDVVVLDPPRYAKSQFGLVDTVGDYQSLFKPALLSTRFGGHMLVTNNVASVTREKFKSMLERCAEKAERPLRSLEFLDVEADFPSPDGQWPLKMAWIEVA